VFNKVNGTYSQNATSQPYSDNINREIDLTQDYALFADYDTMFEIKYPSNDIKIRTKS